MLEARICLSENYVGVSGQGKEYAGWTIFKLKEIDGRLFWVWSEDDQISIPQLMDDVAKYPFLDDRTYLMWDNDDTMYFK